MLDPPAQPPPRSTPSYASDTLYASGTVAEDFTFNDQVAEVFDDMLDRSIPYYQTVIEGIAQLLAARLSDGAMICDLGCSTGTTVLELARLTAPRDFHFIGLDNAPAMLDKARRKVATLGKTDQVSFRESDIITGPMPPASVFLCNYTLQFLRPIARPAFVERLYAALPPNGLLILSEKTISHSGRLNRNFIDIYHAFKRCKGYSELEISAKREALENVLVPFSADENITMLGRAGFAEVEIFFKWFNFLSLVALKKGYHGPL